MQKKNIIKICIDIAMAILLVLMYNKKVISQDFHEIGGLVICGAFAVHMLLNSRWISAVTKRFFSKELSAKVRFRSIIDLLLLLSFIFIAISGILISQSILTNISSSNAIWKTSHQAVSGFALILAGIHLGLHWNFIKKMFPGFMCIPKLIARPLGILCIVVVLFYGGYSMMTSNFSKWISTPIVNITGQTQADNIRQIIDKSSISLENASGITLNANGQGLGQGKNRNGNISPSNILQVIATYLSIVLSIAIVTYWLEKLFSLKNNFKINAKLISSR